MEKYISIGKKLHSKVNKNEIKKITTQISLYTDEQLRNKIIELCLLHEIDCLALIELPRENCRKELLSVLMATT